MERSESKSDDSISRVLRTRNTVTYHLKSLLKFGSRPKVRGTESGLNSLLIVNKTGALIINLKLGGKE